MIKKHVSKLLLILTAFAAMPTDAQISDKALGLGFTAATIGLAIMNEELTESEWFEKLSDKINIDKDDLAPCLVFGSALWAASYLPDDTTARTVLRIGAVLPALAAVCLPKKAINKLAQLPGIKQYFAFMKSAKGLPFIGDMAQCSELGCEGLCHKCKARKFYLTVPLAGIPFVPTIWGSLKATVARWERERITQNFERLIGANARHFRTLGIDVDANFTEATVNRAYRLAARCHPDQNPNNPNAAAEFRAVTEARDALIQMFQQRAAREHAQAHQEPQSPTAKDPNID